ncbi:SAM-dependent methyltransferase [Streptomyces hesseae]|uniref:SAM-dependent methyltransferase n=1 Tax=Streptomyces hesseae TaxID=3075519 RepID=A0ABU2SYV9_9ACTN|nr:SAM-dependent methyltransferase [Streptomyces sp. DSM 40473]MDT0454015.1 SAM-dependent methyltransferase [Streptomyces sp. DSM 40473]
MIHREKSQTHPIDVNTPSAARMYDWLLGGVENYISDRRACARLLDIVPGSQALARHNRAFLGRIVRILAREYGVEQFLDHGAGLPAGDNVHQIVQRINTDCRVVYIDNDPVVAAYGRTMLEENANTAVIEADIRDTETVFDHPQTRRLIKPRCPTAALFVSVLDCLTDTGGQDSPAAVVQRVAARLKKLGPCNFVAICQLVSDSHKVRHEVTELMNHSTRGAWGRVRERGEVRSLFDGFRILEPGLVDVVDWRPDSPPPPPGQRPTNMVTWGGLARL